MKSRRWIHTAIAVSLLLAVAAYGQVTLTVTNPTDLSTVNIAPMSISGTYTMSPTHIRVSIRNSSMLYWDWMSSWMGTQTWQGATVTGGWDIATSGVSWSDGETYNVYVEASEDGGSTYPWSGTSSFTYSTGGGVTIGISNPADMTSPSSVTNFDGTCTGSVTNVRLSLYNSSTMQYWDNVATSWSAGPLYFDAAPAAGVWTVSPPSITWTNGQQYTLTAEATTDGVTYPYSSTSNFTYTGATTVSVVYWDNGAATGLWSAPMNWSGDAVPTSSDSVVFDMTSTASCNLDMAASVKAINFSSLYTGIFSFGLQTLTVTGNAEFQSTGQIEFSNGAQLVLAPNVNASYIYAPMSDTLPAVVIQGSGAYVNMTGGDMYADSMAVLSGGFSTSSSNLQIVKGLRTQADFYAYSGYLDVKGNVEIAGGTFWAPTGYMNVGGGLVKTAGAFDNSGGTVQFTATMPGKTIQPSSMLFKNVIFSGAGGGWTLTDGLKASGRVTLQNGTLYLNSTYDSIASFKATGGSLDFVAAELKIVGDTADFSGIASINSTTGWIKFAGNSPQVFKPKSFMVFPNISQDGTGGTTVLGMPFKASELSINKGTFDLGDGTSVRDSIGFLTGPNSSAAGDRLDLGNDTLDIGGSSASMQYLDSLIAGTGVIRFTGSSTNFTPKPGMAFPTIINKSGTTTLNQSLSADSVWVQGGMFNLGSMSRTHTVKTLKVDLGSSFSFGPCTLDVARHVNIQSLNVSPGAGELRLTSSSGQLQTLTSADTLPQVIHSGSDTLRLGSQLNCTRLLHEAGVLDFQNVWDVAVVNGGTFDVKGTGKLANTGGAMVSANGIHLFGSAADTLDISSVQFTAATVLEAGFARISGSFASPTGVAYHSRDLGGNTNWTFTNAKVWSGGGPDSNWTTAQNWMFGLVPGPSDSVGFNGSTLKPCKLNTSDTINSIRFHKEFTGYFDLQGNTLGITGNADFRSGGDIVPGTGKLAFVGSSGRNQILVPDTSAPWDTLPVIVHSGTDTLTLASGSTTPSTNLSARGLLQTGGVLNLSSAPSPASTTVRITDGGNLVIQGNSASVRTDSIGGAVFEVSGNASFAGQSGNLLGLNPTSNWTINVAGSLNADYCSIGKSQVTGVTGYASNSTNMGSNVNWIFQDLTPPVNDLYVNISAADTNKAAVSWSSTNMYATDVDSVGIWWSTVRFPDSAFDPVASGYRVRDKYSYPDTVSGLVKGTKYYFMMSMRDTAGNWADTVATARDTIVLPLYMGPSWYVSTSGSPSATGTKSSPFSYARKAFQSAGKGDTIKFATGTYAIDSTLYISYDSMVVEGGYASDFSSRNSESLPTILDGAAVAYGEIMHTATALPGLTHVDGLVFKNGPYGMVTSSGTQENIVISNNRFEGCDSAGVNVMAGTRVKVTNNVFSRNGKGISAGGGNGIDIVNNTFALNKTGVRAGYANGVSLANNIFAFQAENAIREDDMNKIDTIRYNAFRGNASVGYNAYSGSTLSLDTLNSRVNAVANLDLDPMFVDTSTSNYYLGQASQCIDAADPSHSYALEPSPNGSRRNLGAYGNTPWATTTDLTPPSGVSISILDNGGVTNNATLVLALGATDASSMRHALTADTGAAAWGVYASSSTITVSGEGLVHVWAQFRDLAGNRSAWVKDSTVYDATAPSGASISIADVNGTTADPALSLTLGATGADSMRIALTADTATAPWGVYAGGSTLTVSNGEGIKVVWAQFKDLAGNRSAWVKDSTVYDVTGPSGVSISIADVNGTTADPALSLTLGATGADSMRLALTADTALAAWQPYTSTSTLTVSTGGEGVKTVWAQFKDLAGNRSAWVSDTTTYDITAPQGATISIAGAARFTSDPTPPLTLTATGADSVRLALGADSSVALWRKLASPDSIDIGGTGCGTKTVYAQFKDKAGNRCSWVSAQTVFDTLRPLATTTAVAAQYSGPSLPASITGTAKDSLSGLKAVYLSLRNTVNNTWWDGQSWVALTTYRSATGTTQWSYTIPMLATGSYELQLNALDSAGNMQVNWTPYAFTVDTDAPTVSTFYIQQNTGYTTSSRIALGFVASGADSMRTAFLGDTTASVWKPYTTLDTLVAGSEIPGRLVACGQFKDRAGNYSGWARDSIYYDPMAPTVVLSLPDTLAVSTWPGRISGTASDSGSGIDSVFIDISRKSTQTYWNGTLWTTTPAKLHCSGTASWSYTLDAANLSNETYIVKVIARDKARQEGIALDSFVYLSSAPAAAFSLSPSSGPAPLSVSFADSSQGTVTGWAWSFGDGTTGSGRTVTHVYQAAGSYTASLTVTGPSGTTTTAKVVTVTDTTRPSSVASLAGTVTSASSVTFTWQPSPSIDADSVKICASMSATPQSVTGAEYSVVAQVRATGALLSGLPRSGGSLYASAFVKDLSGNWSVFSTGATVIVVLPDSAAPQHTLAVTVSSRGDTAIGLTWSTANAVAGDAVRILLGWQAGASAVDDRAFESLPFRDTVLTLAPAKAPGWWYVTTALVDAAGNRSALRFDSVSIANTAPRLLAPADTQITEDRAWQASVGATDVNGDSVSFSLSGAPAGMSLSGGLLSWTPSNADVGVAAVVVQARDARGAVTSDTLKLTVINVNDAPAVAFTGDSIAHEDSLYSARLATSDPDKGDSLVLRATRIPSWLALSVDGGLSGRPSASDIGRDTLEAVVADGAGLADTVIRVITVLNTNDPPLLLSRSIPDTLNENGSLSVVIGAVDPDPGDSLSFVWTIRPSWLSVTSVSKADSVWSFTLAGTPREINAGVNAIAAAISDRSGATVTLADTVTVLDLNNPPVTTASRKIAGGAVEYLLGARDDHDSTFSFEVELSMRKDSTDTTILQRVVADSRLQIYPLPDGSYRFRARATDSEKLFDTSWLTDTFSLTGAGTNSFTDTGSWQMVSAPARQFASSAIGTSALVSRWDEARDERYIYSYYVGAADLTTMQAGESFWMKSSQPVNVRLGRGDFPDSAVSVKLSYGKYGWNQVASPYPYPVRWPGTEVLWKWNGATRDFEEASGVLEPWKGYWVQVDSARTVVVAPAPFFAAQSLARRRMTWFGGTDDWRIQVILKHAAGTDAENVLGFSRAASNGFDRHDRLEPPRMEGDGFLFFVGNGKPAQSGLASDVRKRMADVNTFQAGIVTGASDAQLTFKGLRELAGLYAFISDGKTVTALKEDSAYTVPHKAETQYRTVFVSSDPDIGKWLPMKFSMGKPYPNPFGPMAKIRYTLPYRWDKNGLLVTDRYKVKLAIYDATGRTVREVVYRLQGPGHYEAFWDARSNSGRRVASGSYICRLEAGPFSATERMISVR